MRTLPSRVRLWRAPLIAAAAVVIVASLVPTVSASASGRGAIPTATNLALAIPSFPPTIGAASCFVETAAGVASAIGPASLVVLAADSSSVIETLTSCSAPFVQPLDRLASVSSPFGVRIHPITLVESMHYGTDYARGGMLGTPIKSIANGTVAVSVESYATTGTGNTVVIQHAGATRSQYMHMESPSFLPVGTRVTAGQIIGYVGSTGGSTGPHLHLEVRVAGVLVDPVEFLAKSPFVR